MGSRVGRCRAACVGQGSTTAEAGEGGLDYVLFFCAFDYTAHSLQQ